MTRQYQFNYSALQPALFNSEERNRKAETIVRVCRDFVHPTDLTQLHLLDVGSSNGIIDSYMADYFGQVIGIDIDAPAMAFAQSQFQKPNLEFRHGDALHILMPDNSIDVVICTQIYEHVPDASRMFDEIFRVLRPGGFCYFAGNNRIMLMEPHYRLPLLSVVPRSLAHRYLRLLNKGDYYHEEHFTSWTLQRLCAKFRIVDYSLKIISDPEKFGIEYMLAPGSVKWLAARFIARFARWATPFIWILHKPPIDRTQ
jgi:2-polyprenyl-3-methyl-5-hydroxy-6-metoxy-1,4-benzoquinol methylase